MLLYHDQLRINLLLLVLFNREELYVIAGFSCTRKHLCI